MSILLAAAAAFVFLAQAQPPAPPSDAPDAPAGAADPAKPPSKSDAEIAKEEAKKKEAEAEAIVAEFRKETKNLKAEAELSAAVKRLGGTQHPVILRELARWLGNASAVVSGAAVEGVVKYKNDKNAAEALLRAARNRKDRDGIVKCLAAVGDVGCRSSAAGLAGFFNHEDLDVCRVAIKSCGKLKSKFTVDRLIALARDLNAMRTTENKVDASAGSAVGDDASTEFPELKRKGTLLRLTYSVLTMVTGQRWATVQEWDVWWKKSKADFKELD